MRAERTISTSARTSFFGPSSGVSFPILTAGGDVSSDIYARESVSSSSCHSLILLVRTQVSCSLDRVSLWTMNAPDIAASREKPAVIRTCIQIRYRTMTDQPNYRLLRELSYIRLEYDVHHATHEFLEDRERGCTQAES
jgi:hypothetical protein